MELLIGVILIVSFFLLLKFVKVGKGINSITILGEHVKSKSEKIVADSLYELGVKYIYEKPLIVNDRIVANPDFYLPKYGIYIEFWGILSDPKYVEKMNYKKKKYQEYGLKWIDIYDKDIRNEQKKYLDKEKTKEFLKYKIKKLI